MTDKSTYRVKLESQIREAFGKVVYTYTAHHKIVDNLIWWQNLLKKAQIFLTAISTGGFLTNLLIDKTWLNWLGGVPAALSLGLNLYSKDFNLPEEIKKHKDAANELWNIRETYLSLLTDFEILSDEQIREKRDVLQSRVDYVNRTYPGTDAKGYAVARKAIKTEEEQTFNPGEIDPMLPVELRDKGKK